MKINLKKRKKCLHPKFFSLTQEKECADFFDEYTTSNFLNRNAADFISIDHIQEYALKLGDPKKVEDKNLHLTKYKNILTKLDKKISQISPKDLTPEDLIPYFKILTHHTHYFMGINRISRYGSNPVRSAHIYPWIEQSIKDINLINNYKDDPETGNIELNSWNHILSSGWACIMAGWDDLAYYFFYSLECLIFKQINYSPKNPVFPTVLNQPHVYSRFLMSVYKGLGKVSELRGDKEAAKKYYQKIVDFYPTGEEKLQITWYTGINRVIESNIQLYLLEPTEKRKQEILEQFVKCRSLSQSIDAYETVTESCLVAFMVYKHILKGDLDAIKFR